MHTQASVFTRRDAFYVCVVVYEYKIVIINQSLIDLVWHAAE